MLTESCEETRTSSLPWEQPCLRFSWEEMQSATSNFDETLVIGRGGFGKVYKGSIKYGESTCVVAVKRLDSRSNQGAPEFWAEIEMLSKLRHCNLVSLIGYCNDGEEMILVYEYMPNGTLEDHLRRRDGCQTLSWTQRLKICIGAARGLDYLHTGTGTQHGVIHRDVKSSNFLLDENLAAKISDFGLSKIGPTNQPHTYVSTVVKGTFGYLDPEYFLSGRLTRKSDVYAFGVVLLEVLCGRRAVDTSLDDEEEWGLTTWVRDYIERGKVDMIVDPSLRGQILPSSVKEFVDIASCCLRSRPKERPAVAEIVPRLEFALSLQEGSHLSSTNQTFLDKVRTVLSPKCISSSYSMPASTSGTLDSVEETRGISARSQSEEKELGFAILHGLKFVLEKRLEHKRAKLERKIDRKTRKLQKLNLRS